MIGRDGRAVSIAETRDGPGDRVCDLTSRAPLCAPESGAAGDRHAICRPRVASSSTAVRATVLGNLEGDLGKFAVWEGNMGKLTIALVIGLVAGPIITNIIGWQVTSGALEEQVGPIVTRSQ